MNKQVGQFVRRFNMEEDEFGKFLLKTDKRYHNNRIRAEILPSMFDNVNPRTAGNLKTYFIDDVTNKKHPVFLNFLDKDWYAEVSATFFADGQEVNIILYLTLEEENLGSKWIISNVYYSYFPNLFPEADTLEKAKYFLHPQSHELDFMNLHKALDDPGHIEYYASQAYSPDYLTLFFYQMKKKKLKFKEINSVKFHGYLNATNYPYWSITPVANDPVTTAAGTLNSDINAEATSGYYGHFNEASSFSTGWVMKTLVGNVVSDLQSAMANGWFAIGIVSFASILGIISTIKKKEISVL